MAFSLIPAQSAFAYATGDDYPAKYKNVANNSIVDEWNFYNRQCTSFVSWCLNSRNGVAFTNQYGGVARWGNAKEWISAANSLGITVDNNPAVGSVAVRTTGTYGHVAWVKAVNGDIITIEEYNNGGTGLFSERTVTKSIFDGGFIHIKDISSGQAINSAATSVMGLDSPRAGGTYSGNNNLEISAWLATNQEISYAMAEISGYGQMSLGFSLSAEEGKNYPNHKYFYRIRGVIEVGKLASNTTYSLKIWTSDPNGNFNTTFNTGSVNTAPQQSSTPTNSIVHVDSPVGTISGAKNFEITGWLASHVSPGYIMCEISNYGQINLGFENSPEEAKSQPSYSSFKRFRGVIEFEKLQSYTTYNYKIFSDVQDGVYTGSFTTGNVEAIKYSVTFNANGGEGAPGGVIVKQGERATLPTTAPVRSGYTFLGWSSSSAAASAEYAPGATMTPAANITLYAVWKKTECTVYYDCLTNGGDGSVYDKKVVAAGGKADLTNTAYKTGWEFLGWSTNPDSFVPESSVTVNTDIVLYALFYKKVWAHWYEAGSELPEVDIKESYNNEDYALRVTMPEISEYEDYTALGYRDDTEAKMAEFKVGKEIELIEKTRFYAVYEKNVGIAYKAEGAKNVPDEQTAKSYLNAYGAKTEVSLTVAAAPEKDGYSFVCWEDESGNIYMPYDVAKPEGTMVLTAVWTKPEEEPDTKYSANVTVGNMIARKGEEVEMTVGIEENPGIATYNLKVSFDQTVMTPVKIAQGAALDGGSFTSNLHQGGDLERFDTVTALYVNAVNKNANGELFTVTFKVNENAEEGVYPVSVTYDKGDVANDEYDDVALKIENGSIEVKNVLKGDVYKDFAVNAKDALRLAKFLADFDIELSDYEKMAADLIEDGVISAKDALKLERYLAGFDGASLMGAIEFADKSMTLEVGRVKTDGDGYAYVPVAITKNSGFCAMDVQLNFGEGLTAIEVIKGDALGNGRFTSNVSDGMVSVLYTDVNEISLTGTAFTVKLKVSEDVVNSPITLTYDEVSDGSYEDLAVEIINGEVMAQEAVTADYTITSLNVEKRTGKCYVEAEAVKLSDRTGRDMLVIAVYSENKELMDMVYIKTEPERGKSFGFGATVDFEEGSTVKCFVWESLSGMKALSNVLEK